MDALRSADCSQLGPACGTQAQRLERPTRGHARAPYEVNCQIHDPGGQAPPGTSEGVKINARGVNFNKHVTGDNLFVMTS